MRWRHPVKGFIGPDVVHSRSREQTGLIAQMGSWVIQQACMDAVTWPDDITVSVNISAFQFKDANRLIENREGRAADQPLAPNRLELEVTESLLIEDQKSDPGDDPRAAPHRRAVLARRFRHRLLVARISRALSVLEGRRSTAAFARRTSRPIRRRVSIIEAVCGLANRLGLRVVVEGIETEEQRQEVKASGRGARAEATCSDRPETLENIMPRIRRAA